MGATFRTFTVCVLGLGALAQESRTSAPASRFEMRSGFWVNLHHVLLQQVNSPKPPAAPEMSAEEAAAWNAAIDVYRRELARRSVLDDRRMLDLQAAVIAWDGGADHGKSTMLPEARAALERAEPVYRARLWAQHDRANREWIAGIRPLLDSCEADLLALLAKAYGADWPPGPIRVDVSVDAGRFGGYTISRPTRVTISSLEEGNRGWLGVEALFHEASHGLDDGVSASIDAAARALGRKPPEQLWHAILFYTPGELLRRELAKRGTAHEPYAYKFGLYRRGDWPAYERALRAHWQPHLDGKTDFARAIADVVAAL